MPTESCVPLAKAADFAVQPTDRLVALIKQMQLFLVARSCATGQRRRQLTERKGGNLKFRVAGQRDALAERVASSEWRIGRRRRPPSSNAMLRAAQRSNAAAAQPPAAVFAAPAAIFIPLQSAACLVYIQHCLLAQANEQV